MHNRPAVGCSRGGYWACLGARLCGKVGSGEPGRAGADNHHLRLLLPQLLLLLWRCRCAVGRRARQPACRPGPRGRERAAAQGVPEAQHQGMLAGLHAAPTQSQVC